MHAHPSSRSAGRPPVRSMALTWASAVVPGLAHWVAGRRRAAVVIFSLALALLIGVAVLALTTSRTELLRMAVQPGWLTIVIVIALALALAWVVLVTGSYRVLGPVRQTGVAQVGVILGLAAGKNGGGSDEPFAGRDRVTILLLASDAGPDRTGTRTDSMVAASIDTHTGDVILFSLPRNLENVPMPPGPLREQWPNGFPDLLNGVYQFVTNQPHLLAGARDRGAAGIKSVVSYILGMPIDYYAMVNLEGFNEFIDAIGGVTVNVTQRLPIGGLLADGTRVPPVGYIQPGIQHLDGTQAQWYARSRRDGTDYDRMLRQRCLIGAMVQQATPGNVLKHFQELSSATKRLAETDIPRSVLPDLISLGDKMHGGATIRSLAFVPPVISTANPDYAKIRKLVSEALQPPKPAAAATPAASPSTSAAPKPSKSPPTGMEAAPAAGNGSPVDVKSACALG